MSIQLDRWQASLARDASMQPRPRHSDRAPCAVAWWRLARRVGQADARLAPAAETIDRSHPTRPRRAEGPARIHAWVPLRQRMARRRPTRPAGRTPRGPSLGSRRLAGWLAGSPRAGMMLDECSCWHDGATRRRAGQVRSPRAHRPIVSRRSVPSLRAPPAFARKVLVLLWAWLHVRTSLPPVGKALPKRAPSACSTVVMFCRGRRGTYEVDRPLFCPILLLLKSGGDCSFLSLSCAAPPRSSSVVG